MRQSSARPLLAALGSVLALGLLTLASEESHAQNLSAAKTCAALTIDAARLACYDAAFSVDKPAETQFGDNGQLRRDLKSKAGLPKLLTSRVRQAIALAQGRYRLSLENGQVWQTIEADWATDFKAGDTVTISRLALGGYDISSGPNGRAVRVKRIE